MKRGSADDDKPAQRVYRSVKITKHGTIRYIRYGFSLLYYRKFFPKTFFELLDLYVYYTQVRVTQGYRNRHATYDFLLMFHSNHGPISYRFRDKPWFQSKIIAKFSHPRVFYYPADGIRWTDKLTDIARRQRPRYAESLRVKTIFNDFYRAMLCVSAVFAVGRCLLACLFVTFVYYIQMAKDMVKLLLRPDSPTILVSLGRPVFPNSEGNPSAGSQIQRWEKSAIFDWNRGLSVYLRNGSR